MQETQEVRLKPCPFCLSDTEYLGFSFYTRMHGKSYCVICMDCQAKGPETDSLESAKKYWNTRGKND